MATTQRSKPTPIRRFSEGHFEQSSPIVIPQTGGGSASGALWPKRNSTRDMAGIKGEGRTSSILYWTGLGGGDSLITTEGYGTQPVFTALIRDLGIYGPHDLGSSPKSNPALTGLPYLGSAIKTDAKDNLVEFCRIADFQGYGISQGHTGNGGYNGHVIGSEIYGCFSGINCRTDHRYFNNYIVGMRDHCLYMGPTVGNIQVCGNHCFGAVTGLYALNANPAEFSDNTFADCDYGVNLDGTSGGMFFVNCFSQHNILANWRLRGGSCLTNCRTYIAKRYTGNEDAAGFVIRGRGNVHVGGSIALGAYTFPWGTVGADGSTAVRLINGSGNVERPCDNRFIETTIGSVTWPDSYGGGAFDLADVLVRVSGNATGNKFHFLIPAGFGRPSPHAQRILTIDSGFQAAFQHNTILIEGPHLHTSGSAFNEYFSILTGGIDSTNSVKIRNTSTGVETELTYGQAYP